MVSEWLETYQKKGIRSLCIENRVYYWGSIGIMEKKMETTILQ